MTGRRGTSFYFCFNIVYRNHKHICYLDSEEEETCYCLMSTNLFPSFSNQYSDNSVRLPSVAPPRSHGTTRRRSKKKKIQPTAACAICTQVRIACTYTFMYLGFAQKLNELGANVYLSMYTAHNVIIYTDNLGGGGCRGWPPLLYTRRVYPLSRPCFRVVCFYTLFYRRSESATERY